MVRDKRASSEVPSGESERVLDLHCGHVVYAADQPEYQPLPVWRRQSGAVVSRWRLSWRERFAVLFGRDLYLEVLTYGQPLQPLYPTTSEADVFGWSEPVR